ncbi:MAG: hydroxymethylglutaryl-CoA lyase [Acidimicrobiia bacterium]
MRTPEVVPADDAPENVTVYEVGPRDGLQNEPTVMPVEVKVEFVERLVAAGVAAVELTSFVRPDLVPQLGDAEQLMTRLSLPEHVRTVALTPNLRGAQRALELGVKEIAIFASATETFSQKNLNCSIDDSFRRFAPVVALARENGLSVRAYVSMCFGDPWEGDVPLASVVGVGRRLLGLGAGEVSIGDTIGVATPGHVVALVRALGAAGIGVDRLAVHFHDTYGQALANASAALRAGVRVVDASAGGLGGCPFAASATGNLATEDLLWLLHGMGVSTGIDLPAMVETSTWLATQLGRPSASRVVQALTR